MMRVSLYGGADVATVGEVVARAELAAARGLDAVWFPQTANLDTLTALAAAATRIEGVDLATGVVPIQGRHPVPLALQALTVSGAAGPGRFTLGVGVTHAAVSQAWFGVPYEGIVELCEEELTVLGALLAPGRSADFAGSRLAASVQLRSEAPQPSLVLAAMGPRMLELAGRLAEGTVTWMTGPRSLARRIVPTVRRAAREAGRPDPRVVAGFPLVVTDDVAVTRARLDEDLAGTAALASYARSLAAEGVDRPSGVAIVGDEETVAARLDDLAAAGVTEVVANVVAGPGADDDRARTLALLGQRAARQGVPARP